MIFCERKKLKVSLFLLQTQTKKVMHFHGKFQKYKDEVTGKKIFFWSPGGVGAQEGDNSKTSEMAKDHKGEEEDCKGEAMMRGWEGDNLPNSKLSFETPQS